MNDISSIKLRQPLRGILKINLVIIGALFACLLFNVSPVGADESEENIVTGTHEDVFCATGYRTINSPSKGVVCVKTRYICNPADPIEFGGVTLEPTTQRFYRWRCLQYIQGLQSNGQISCPEGFKVSSVRKSDCYIIVRLVAKSKYRAPSSCSITGYERFACTFPDAANKLWVPTVNTSNPDPYSPLLIQSSCSPYDYYGRPVQAISVYIETYDKICNAAKDDGLIFTVTSSYRTFAEQQNLYDIYGPGSVLPPEESLHTQGLAIDFLSSAWEWLHEIVGCKNMNSGKFSYRPFPISYQTYSGSCGSYSHVYPVKRSQLYGLSPLCEDLQTNVQWNLVPVIRCEGNQASGLRYEPWHFELDSTFRVFG